MDEIFKEINGFNRYLISNKGRVIDQTTGKEKYPFIQKKGYFYITLKGDDNKWKLCKIHRLVALTFIPNPDNLPQVNHKDENKLNNCVENLEWCANEYNCNYGTRTQRATESNKCCPATSKKIYSIDKNCNIEYFDSIGEAERQTGLPHCNIVRTLKNRTHTCGGRKWFYCEDKNA